MDSWQNWNWLFGSVNTSENVGRLKNTWESLSQRLWWQVVQMEMNVVTIWTNSSSFKDFHGHCSGYDISGGEIFSSWSISLHESLTIAVSKDTTLTSASFGDEATSSINTSWVELDEFWVLDWKASSSDHTGTITSAGVCGCA
jgi:exopolysaccharide biosynthesis protein